MQKNAKQQTAQQPVRRLTIELNDVDVENLIAFGNRANMTGAEAEVWVRLKMGLIAALEQGADDDPGIVTGLSPAEVARLQPGGTD